MKTDLYTKTILTISMTSSVLANRDVVDGAMLMQLEAIRNVMLMAKVNERTGEIEEKVVEIQVPSECLGYGGIEHGVCEPGFRKSPTPKQKGLQHIAINP